MKNKLRFYDTYLPLRMGIGNLEAFYYLYLTKPNIE